MVALAYLDVESGEVREVLQDGEADFYDGPKWRYWIGDRHLFV